MSLSNLEIGVVLSQNRNLNNLNCRGEGGFLAPVAFSQIVCRRKSAIQCCLSVISTPWLGGAYGASVAWRSGQSARLSP